MQEEIIYEGSRGKDFKDMIFEILKRSNLKDKYMEPLLTDESMSLFSKVFTSPTANPVDNYELFEIMGDVTANKFIVLYMLKRFPKLFSNEAVQIVARLKIVYGSKQTFFGIAERLGFWPYITAAQSERDNRKKSLLEDSFEAFLGCVEFILDRTMINGVGYTICYNILESIFNDMDISLKYEDLYDAKTRLKEIYDMAIYKPLGTIEYKETKTAGINTSEVFQVSNVGGRKNYTLIGRGSAALKQNAQQSAAINALVNLKRKGIYKPVPKIFEDLNL